MQSRTPAEKLLELMKALGYPSTKGPCIGLSMMAINAFLCGEIAEYITRLDIIKNTSDLANQIANLKTKVRQHQTLSAKEQSLINIVTFLENIFLLLQPDKYSAWFKKPVYQYQYEKISKLIASEKLQLVGGLRNIKSWIGTYNKNELLIFINLLEQGAQQHKENLALVLDDDGHEITLCYDVKQSSWILIDTIMLAAFSLKTPHVADAIFKAFDMKGDFIALATHIFATKMTRKTVKSMLNAVEQSEPFLQLHKITQAKAHIKTEYGLSLLNLAAQMGFADIVAKLMAEGAVVSAKTLMLAAQNGHAKVIDGLKNKVDFDVTNENGATAMYLAAQCGHAKAIRVLAKHGANVNPERKGGWKPVIIAAKEGKVSAVRSLAKSGADLTVVNQTGKSAAHFAVDNNDVKVLKVLAKYGSQEAKSHLQTKFNLFCPAPRNSEAKVSQPHLCSL